MDLPLVSIVIPTYNRKDKLVRLLNSILDSDYPKDRFGIVVVDDASSDGTFETIKAKFPQDNIKVIRNYKNQLVSETRNIGIRNSQGEYIFFIDDDMVIHKKTIYKLVEFFQQYGNDYIVAPIIYQFEKLNFIWSAGVKINFFTTFGKFIHYNKLDRGKFKNPIKCDTATASFMIHRSLINKVGYFNSTLFPVGFEEIDLCIRASFLRYKIFTLPSAKVWLEHKRGQHLNEVSTFYFGIRNRFIAHKLWSKNFFQLIFSQFFSIIFAFIFLFIKLIFPRQNQSKCIKALFRGVWEGLVVSGKVSNYISQFKKVKRLSR